MNRNLLSKIIALFSGIVLIYVAYNHNNNSIYEIKGSAYGTTWTIKSSEYIGDHHKDNIKKIISNIDYIASNYKEESEISIINNNNKKYYFVSSDLFNILSIAKDVENISQGYYNITLGKISSNLGFSPTFGKNLIHKKNDTFKLDETNKSLEKLSSNWFDLSSIAKGYAVQVVHEYLIHENLLNHLIDIGGEIIVSGSNNEKPWAVGIQNPLSQSDDASVIIKNNNNFLAIASSGEYRNYKSNRNGEKITHTINPNTLESIKNSILSVTVIHETSATYADAYSTAFNAMGRELAMNTANNNNIALMLIIENDNKINIIYSDKWYDLVK